MQTLMIVRLQIYLLYLDDYYYLKIADIIKNILNGITEGITLDEIKAIYSKCGIEFYDLILSKNFEESKIENSNGVPQLIKKR